MAAFAVARDGSRMAVAYAGNPAPALRVVDILRTDEGIVSGAGQLARFADGRSDAARIVDIGWRDPATLAVLTRPTDETSEVSFVSSDGSPVVARPVQPSVFRGAGRGARGLARHRPAAAPDHPRPAALHAQRQRSWPRSSSRVAAATYVALTAARPQPDPRRPVLHRPVHARCRRPRCAVRPHA